MQFTQGTHLINFCQLVNNSEGKKLKMNQTCQSEKTDSIGDNRREPVIKMSTMGRIRTIKKPKCRLKLLAMALCSCVIIVVVILLATFRTESSETEEEKNYSGE